MVSMLYLKLCHADRISKSVNVLVINKHKSILTYANTVRIMNIFGLNMLSIYRYLNISFLCITNVKLRNDDFEIRSARQSFRYKIETIKTGPTSKYKIVNHQFCIDIVNFLMRIRRVDTTSDVQVRILNTKLVASNS